MPFSRTRTKATSRVKPGIAISKLHPCTTPLSHAYISSLSNALHSIFKQTRLSGVQVGWRVGWGEPYFNVQERSQRELAGTPIVVPWVAYLCGHVVRYSSRQVFTCCQVQFCCHSPLHLTVLLLFFTRVSRGIPCKITAQLNFHPVWQKFVLGRERCLRCRVSTVDNSEIFIFEE